MGDTYRDELAHYGVKGMRWRVSKRQSSIAPQVGQATPKKISQISGGASAASLNDDEEDERKDGSPKKLTRSPSNAVRRRTIGKDKVAKMMKQLKGMKAKTRNRNSDKRRQER